METLTVGSKAYYDTFALWRMTVSKPYYIMWTHAGAYVLAEDGTILYDQVRHYRSYSGQWRIIGISKRHHSHDMVSLEDAANGANIGQGWVHDLDHGTHRMWAMPKDRRATSVVRASADYKLPV